MCAPDEFSYKYRAVFGSGQGQFLFLQNQPLNWLG
jgi:hypothetical protein